MELSSSLGSVTFFLLLLFAPSKRAPLCFRKRWRFYFVVESPAQAIIGVHYHKIIIKRELLFSVWIYTYVCLYVCSCASLPPPLSSSPMSAFTWLQQPHGHIAHYFFSHSSPPPPPFHAVFSSFSLSLRPYFSHIHHFSASVHFFFPLRKKGQHNTEEDSQYSSSVRVFFVVYLHDLVPFLFDVCAVTASHAWLFWFWLFFCRVVSAFVICP